MNYYTVIPIGLCEYALINRKVNHMKLYLVLKLKSSGYISYNSNPMELINSLAKELSLTSKTIKNCFLWLLKNKWVTINSKRKAIHIKSYKKLFKYFKTLSNVSMVYEPDNFNDFKAFCCGAVVIYYRNQKRYLDKQSDVKMGHPKTNCNKISIKGFLELPCSYLAKCLNISKTSAYNFKKAAHEFGFIIKKKNYTLLTDERGKYIEKKHYQAMKIYLKFNYEDIGRRLRKGNKYLQLVDSDLIKSNVVVKSRNSKAYEKL